MTVTDATLTIYQGEDKTISVTITEGTSAKNLTGALDISFSVYDHNGDIILSKSLADDVTITDAAAGEISIDIAAADTSNVEAMTYLFSIVVTDANDISIVVTQGAMNILFNGSGIMSIAEVKALVNTELTDYELSRVLTTCLGTVYGYLGGIQTADLTLELTENFWGDNGGNLFLPQRIVTVTTVTEDDVLLVEDTGYRVWEKEARLERLPLGTLWGNVIEVVFVPAYNPEVKSVLADLVRLEVERKAVSGETIGQEYGFTALPNYDKERQSIMRRIRRMAV